MTSWSWFARGTLQTRGFTLGEFSVCLFLCLFDARGASLPAATSKTAASPVLTRRDGEVANKSGKVSLELSPHANMHLTGTTNKTDQLPNTNSTIHLKKDYVMLAHHVECSAEYAIRTAANSVEECARACMAEVGCVVFSFHGRHNGCRISMCGDAYARQATGQGCGKSDGKVLTVKSGCGTGSAPGSKLYAITETSRLLQRAQRGTGAPIAPYQMLRSNAACGKYYKTAVSAGDAGDCAVACSKAAGCWAFSFSHGDCRLSACLDSKAKNAEGECGASNTGSGIVGLSTQCAVEDSADANMYLILQLSVLAKDAGCIGQYKRIQGVSSVDQCRKKCISHSECKVFSYGPMNGCRLSSCLNETVKGPCDWTVESSKSSAGFANHEKNNMTLDDAKARCLELGQDTCRAITCYQNNTECSVRSSGTTTHGLLDETTHIPAAACYQALVQGQGHQCGASDQSVFSWEGQCFLGSSPGDYVYDIPTKLVKINRPMSGNKASLQQMRNQSWKHPIRK